MEKSVERSFSRHAASYDKYSLVQLDIAQKLLDSFFQNAVEDIFEIGCGTGNYTILLSKRFLDAHILAIDISLAMLNVALNKDISNVEFVKADANEFCSIRKFDLITSNACLQWVDDLGLTLAACRAMLNKGGVVTFSTFGPKTFYELSTVMRLFAKGGKISAQNFLSLDGLTTTLKQLFTEVEIIPVIINKEFEDLNDFLRTIKYSGTRGFGLEGKQALSRADLKEIEGLYLGEFGKITATYEVFLCRAKD
jgi:malonyl-CoA O-methyltransferase